MRGVNVTELGRLEGFRVGSVGPLLITVFDQTATVERLTLLDTLQGRFITRNPKMYALNVIIGVAVQQPEPAVREKAAALQQKYDAANVAAVTVLAVKGLGAVLARGFLAALALVSGGSKPTQVFKTLAEAVTWLRGLPNAPAALKALEVSVVVAFVAGVK